VAFNLKTSPRLRTPTDNFGAHQVECAPKFMSQPVGRRSLSQEAGSGAFAYLTYSYVCP
jgi:hypothetical protein